MVTWSLEQRRTFFSTGGMSPQVILKSFCLRYSLASQLYPEGYLLAEKMWIVRLPGLSERWARHIQLRSFPVSKRKDSAPGSLTQENLRQFIEQAVQEWDALLASGR
jgi:hypothetical protein